MQLKLMLLALAACAACLAPGPSRALSIESEPVKVTHRNSGPRYDLDEELDKSKLTPVSEAPAAAADEQQAASSKKPATSGDEQPAEPQEERMPLGQVSIRRFLLVPVMRPARPDWQEESVREPSEHQLDHQQAPPSMFAKPFWPFLTPARPSHHLFGADEASRSPQVSRGPEREREREDTRPAGSQEQPVINPFQLMLEMMQQALNGQLAGSMPGDLSEGASSAAERGNGESASSGVEKPQVPASVKPQASNETREDIVEIEGKKYLRKTLINRHVGENIIFMTKRLVFVPLNETESTTSSDERPAIPTSSTTEATPASTVESRVSSTPAKPIEEATTSTTGAPTTEAASEPTTTATAASISEQPSGTQKESLVERVSEALEKVAERVAERVVPTTSSTTSTTEKPASS